MICLSPALSHQQAAHMALEHTARSLGNNQANVFIKPRIWLDNWVVIFEQLIARCNQRANQHAVEALHAHLAVKADFAQMREAVCIVGIGLVARHVERRLGMTGINADRRQALG